MSITFKALRRDFIIIFPLPDGAAAAIYGPTRPSPKDFAASGYSKNSRLFFRRKTAAWHKTGGYCVYCFAALDYGGRIPNDGGLVFEVDHVHPRLHGGTDAGENLVPACQPCNASKGHKILRAGART